MYNLDMLSGNNADQPVFDQHSCHQQLLASSEPFSTNTKQNSNLQNPSCSVLFLSDYNYDNSLIKNAAAITICWITYAFTYIYPSTDMANYSITQFCFQYWVSNFTEHKGNAEEHFHLHCVIMCHWKHQKASRFHLAPPKVCNFTNKAHSHQSQRHLQLTFSWPTNGAPIPQFSITAHTACLPCGLYIQLTLFPGFAQTVKYCFSGLFRTCKDQIPGFSRTHKTHFQGCSRIFGSQTWLHEVQKVHTSVPNQLSV